MTNAALGAEDGKCQKYLLLLNFACLVTNAALGTHWSGVKICAEDGKCVKNGSVHVNNVGTSIYNVDFDSQIIVTHMSFVVWA